MIKMVEKINIEEEEEEELKNLLTIEEEEELERSAAYNSCNHDFQIVDYSEYITIELETAFATYVCKKCGIKTDIAQGHDLFLRIYIGYDYALYCHNKESLLRHKNKNRLDYLLAKKQGKNPKSNLELVREERKKMRELYGNK